VEIFLCWICRIDVSESRRITLHTFIYLWSIWQRSQSRCTTKYTRNK